VKGLTKISKIFTFSAPFGKFFSILCKTPNFAQVADSAKNCAHAEF